MSGELDYSAQDRADAKGIMEWLNKIHAGPTLRVERVLVNAPQFIKTAIIRLTFRHMDIAVVDLMDTLTRVINA